MMPVKWLLTLAVSFFCILPATHSTAAGQPVTVCIQCHAALPPALSDPVKLWQVSIHAERGIGCTACHGGDPMDSVQSMNTARGFRGVPIATALPALCGGCHSVITTYYMRSDHGRALGRGGPSCITCHGSHDIKRASPDLLGKKYCSQCHTFEKARLIRSAMLKRDSMLMAYENKIKNMKVQGIETGPMENRLYSLRGRFHAVFHSFDIEQIIKESDQIQAELEKTIGKDGRGAGISTGIVAVCCVLLAGLLLFLVSETAGNNGK
jgi:hypothetical protein